ncbi:uncharacterized protein LOC128547667 [Mercenaria mercenaria]|uniref:uncharacterized protein LOC128547667 n=1 Tax=Mercenaria mercenaria TaxID=6596 RepID=UPI00234F2074|nr:uncharacterized protein LOC128547667 [Mercenaria mercenaria]
MCPRTSTKIMCSVLRKEFKLAHFSLSHHSRDDFIFAQWERTHAVFQVYRVSIALYTSAFILYILSTGMSNDMAYLTTWTYLVLTFYFLFSAFNAIFYTCRGHVRHQHESESLAFAENRSGEHTYDSIAHEEMADSGYLQKISRSEISPTIDAHDNVKNGHMPSYLNQEGTSPTNHDVITIPMKAAWVLGNTLQVFAIIVSLVYFIVLYPAIGHTSFWDINLHGVNSFLVIIDTCISARPVRLFHLIHPYIYGACYVIFSAIYWSFDHANNVLYPGVLDWNYPGTTLIWVAALTLVVVPLLQLIYFGAYRLRLNIYHRYNA